MSNMIQLGSGGLRLEIPASALFDAMRDYLAAHSAEPARRADIGQHLPGQGGIYAGDILGDDGVTYGIIVASEDSGDMHDTCAWGPEDGERAGASTWDGLANTNNLLRCGKVHAVARVARGYSADGHTDFYLPSKREMQIVVANLPYLFRTHTFQSAPYWTSTPHRSHFAWAANFLENTVARWGRSAKFRVRSVRRFTY